MPLIASQEPGPGRDVRSSPEGDPRDAMPELAAIEQSLQQYSEDAKGLRVALRPAGPI
jgi:hypothetical protein